MGGFCGLEGKLTEAYGPIPERMGAHLHLGKDQARGMGYRGLYYECGSKCKYFPGKLTFGDQTYTNLAQAVRAKPEPTQSFITKLPGNHHHPTSCNSGTLI